MSPVAARSAAVANKLSVRPVDTDMELYEHARELVLGNR
jgi:hypothetical protein